MPQAAVPTNPVPTSLSTAATTSTSASYCMHPLSGSVATIDRAVDWMSFRLVDLPGSEWTCCEQALSEPEFFTRWRALVGAWLGAQHSEIPDRTTAGYVLQWYLSIPAYLGAMLFHSARRVPALRPQQLAFRFDHGWVEEVALRPGRFCCLAGDPDSGHPDAVVLPDEEALGAELRREVVSHATRFLRVYGPLVRFGRRTLWAAVTDILDSGLLLAGRSFGSTQAGAADARLVLAQRFEPLTSASTTCSVTDDRGRLHWTRRRGSCCFSYALPGVAEPCATCPRTDNAGRARILGTLDQP